MVRILIHFTEKEMTKIRGNDIAMIFQDPMTALNPTMKVGKQITEVILKHKKVSTHRMRKNVQLNY